LGYHLLNLALFGVIVVLFFELIGRWTNNTSIAFWASLLYAVHPINSMLVNYITASVISTHVIALQLSFLFYAQISPPSNDQRKSSVFRPGPGHLFTFLSIESGYPPLHYYIAQYFWRENKPDQARGAINTAIGLDPKNTTYQSFLSTLRQTK